jgi:phosphosulfolactate synthase
MKHTSKLDWHPALADPTGRRDDKPRRSGQTMVIDKGLGLRALLLRKIELARESGIHVMPGGTFLEVAIYKREVKSFFDTVRGYGFTAIEVSDGTIEVTRSLRSSLIVRGIDQGLTVVTEHGKKLQGSSIELEELAETVKTDTELGAAFVTIEARESGKGVGIFDENGACKAEDLQAIVNIVSDGSILMWEAPLKSQQTDLLQALGPNLNIGNVAPEDILALEALRRGLRSDTFHLGQVTRV